MRRAVAAATVALAIPASALGAGAEPKRYALSATVQPGEVVALSIGAIPRGRFAFSLAATSEAQKDFVFTQQRTGKKEITILRVPNQPAYSACDGGSTAIYGPGPVACNRLTFPALAKSRYTWRVKNLGAKPLKVGVVIKWLAR